MTSTIEWQSSLVVGSVEAVAPDQIRVLLDLDAPYATAFNTGTPTPFPRLNGYVLIPNEAGATVGYVSWIGIERSPYPKRTGLKDFGLIDVPFPLRKMTVSPVGTLTSQRDRTTGATNYELSRGVRAFPSVGDQVMIPTVEQIAAIVGAKDSDKRVRIGVSPMSASATIMIDPDKLFGRHLAVLGNTGSGKSCTVAGLIRWSLDAAKRKIEETGGDGQPNARFIILDPNGEYSKAFADLGDRLRLFRVPPVRGNERPLDIPAWAWNGHEWTAVAHAQPGAQRPLLLQGLRELKSGQAEQVPREAIIRRYLASYSTRVSAILNAGTQAFAGSPRSRFDCARLLQPIALDAEVFAASIEEPTKQSLTDIAQLTTNTINSRRSENNPQFFDDFTVSDLEAVRGALDDLIVQLPDLGCHAPISEDAPLHFDVNMLGPHLERIATDQGANVAGFVSTLGLRIRGMLSDQRLGSVINREPHIAFDDWLNDYVGGNLANNGQVAVVDLSLVPSEIIHIVISVLGRLIFESLQRYRRTHPEGKPLPTVLVLEEAHTFVKRTGGDDANVTSPAHLCRETFERISREGRKFGLGLVLSSQRPSELSPTVLAQCNTFLLHRIVNDSDQNLVSRLVPDNVGGLLKELPSLPSRQAILLGWATPLPVLVEIDELLESERPRSSDPDFWDVWTLSDQREIDWPLIVQEWSKTGEAE